MADTLTLTLNPAAALKLQQLVSQRGSGTEAEIIAEALEGWFSLDLLTDAEAQKLAASVMTSLAASDRSGLEAARERLLSRYAGQIDEAVQG